MSSSSSFSGAVPPALFAPHGPAHPVPPPVSRANNAAARGNSSAPRANKKKKRAIPKWNDEVEVYTAVPVAPRDPVAQPVTPPVAQPLARPVAEPVVAPAPVLSGLPILAPARALAPEYVPPVTTPEELEDEVLDVRRMVVASGMSMIVNMVLLILLGLIVATPPLRENIHLVELDVSASEIDDGRDTSQRIEMEKPPTVSVDRPAGGALTSRLVVAPSPKISPKPPGPVIGPPAIIGGPVGGDTPGDGTTIGDQNLAPARPGDGNGAQFFGVQASGRKIAFVVDRSGSMDDYGRHTRCRIELIESLRSLKSNQFFYVVYFSDQVLPMPDRRLVAASLGNINRTINWLKKTEPAGSTEPVPGIKLVLQQKPDAIYLLTDGSFRPEALSEILALQPNTKTRIPIHTIAFENEEGEAVLKEIAKETGGRYRFVP